MTDLEKAVGFWSYRNRDDTLSKGRIRKLAQDIAGEYELLTGHELGIFVDKESLEWGAEWRSRIEAALAGTTFLIPVITPGFFASEACREEVLTFSLHAKSAGLSDLLLPILYAPVPRLSDDSPDEVVSLIAGRQYIDWTTLRTADDNSPEYRAGLANVAERLIKILESSVEVATANELSMDHLGDDGVTVLEALAEAEQGIPRWTAVINDISTTMQEIANITANATIEVEKVDKRGDGYTGRLRISHEFAKSLAEPVERFYELGNQYTAELTSINPGMLLLLREVPKQNVTDAEKDAVVEFFSIIRQVISAANGNLESIHEFRESMRELRKLSKAMRPAATKIDATLTKIIDGQLVMNEWLRVIGESELL